MTTKPDMRRAWANAGAVAAPSTAKIDSGWIAEKPPYQNENWIQNRADQWIQSTEERGTPEWDINIIYPYHSTVFYGNETWVSRQASNIGNAPFSGSGWWITPQELSTPVGLTGVFAGLTFPDGWMICNGAAIDRTTYSRLFSLLGESFGAGDGATTFNIPDLTNRIPIGVGSIASYSQNVGSEQRILSVSNMPQHNHSFSGDALPPHSHSMPAANTTGLGGYGTGTGSIPGNPDGVTGSSSSGTPSGSISNTGNGAQFSIVQPGIGLNWIIKY